MKAVIIHAITTTKRQRITKWTTWRFLSIPWVSKLFGNVTDTETVLAGLVVEDGFGVVLCVGL